MRQSLILGFFVLVGRLVAVETAPAIWRLDQTARIGGHPVEVLGTPRVVTEPSGPAVFFDGASDGLYVPVNPLDGHGAFTIEVWFKPAGHGPAEQRFLHVEDTLHNRGLFEIRVVGNGWALDTFLFSARKDSKLVLLDRLKLHPTDRWTWIALVYADGCMTSYINGVKELEGPVDFPPMTAGRVSLGVRQNKVSWFQGGIREVRWHATALKAKQLQR